MNGAPDRLWLIERKQATSEAKYRGLSTARRTVKLPVASVEMTQFLCDDEAVRCWSGRPTCTILHRGLIVSGRTKTLMKGGTRWPI